MNAMRKLVRASDNLATTPRSAQQAIDNRPRLRRILRALMHASPRSTVAVAALSAPASRLLGLVLVILVLSLQLGVHAT